MSFLTIIQTVAGAPAFAGRPFLALFAITAIGRLIHESRSGSDFAQNYTLGLAPLLAGFSDMQLPLWLIGNLALGVLLLLVFVEGQAEKDATAAELYNGLNTNLIKPGVTIAANFGMIEGQTGMLANMVVSHAPPWLLTFLVGHEIAIAAGPGQDTRALVLAAQAAALAWIGPALALGWAMLTGVATWLIAQLRNGVVALISNLDDGSLGLRRLYMFTEGGWTLVSVIILVVFPVLALILAGLTLLTLFGIRTWMERRDERSKQPCGRCATAMYPTAPFCPSCRQPNPAPRAVGLFGQATERPAGDPAQHRLNLVARKRCPVCATRLKQAAVRQSCAGCGTVTFHDISEVNTFLRAIDRRLPVTLLIVFGLGLIPVIGIVPGMAYYRLSLLASLRSYVPRTTGCFTNVGLRIINIGLVMLQAIPVFGMVALPTMALINYVVYRRVLYGVAVGDLGRPAASGALVPSGGAQPAGGPGVVPPAHQPVQPPPVVPPVGQPPQPPVMPSGPAMPPPGAGPSAAGPRFCMQCGTPREGQARFCTGCGTALG